MSYKKWLVILFCGYIAPIKGLCQTFFTPRDDIRSQLILLIKQERQSIDAAMYMFTDKTIAQALIDAYVRGVKIRIILDQISMDERYGKGLFLRNNGIIVFIHATANFNAFNMPIMHHKFFIFGQNEKTGKGLLWTGSYNCTASASSIHDENVIVTDDLYAIQEYRQCFIAMLTRLSPGRCWNTENNVENLETIYYESPCTETN